MNSPARWFYSHISKLAIPLLILMTAAVAVCAPAVSYFLDRAVSGIEPGMRLWDIAVSLAMLGAAMLLETWLWYFLSYAAGRSEARGRIRSEREIQSVLLGARFDAAKAWTLGDIFTRLQRDLAVLSGFYTMELFDILSTLAVAAAGMVWMFFLNWQLTLLYVIVLPLLVFLLDRVCRRVEQSIAQERKSLSAANTQLLDSAGLQQSIRLFDLYERQAARFDEASREVLRMNVRISRLGLLRSALRTVGSTASMLVLFGAGTFLVMTERMTVGEWTAYYFVSTRAAGWLSSFDMLLMARARVKPSWQRIRELLTIPPDPAAAAADADALPASPDSPALELAHVSFSYAPDGPAVLRDVSLRVRPGEKVAVVGESGCGKSTLFSLIMGLNGPTGGRIFLNGRDVAAMTRTDVDRSAALVDQRTYLFDGSVGYNVALGDTDPPRDRLLESVHWAAADFVTDWPDTLDHPVGQGGGLLSGGQRQRLGIARAHYRRPDIYLMDEVTSALDEASERRVLDHVLSSPATVLYISHKLAVCSRFDRILVLKDGQIAESGSFDELTHDGNTIFAGLLEKEQRKAASDR